MAIGLYHMGTLSARSKSSRRKVRRIPGHKSNWWGDVRMASQRRPAAKGELPAVKDEILGEDRRHGRQGAAAFLENELAWTCPCGEIRRECSHPPLRRIIR